MRAEMLCRKKGTLPFFEGQQEVVKRGASPFLGGEVFVFFSPKSLLHKEVVVQETIALGTTCVVPGAGAKLAGKFGLCDSAVRKKVSIVSCLCQGAVGSKKACGKLRAMYNSWFPAQ